jgi:hypothetical protein
MKREGNMCFRKALAASAAFLCASVAHAQLTNVGALLDQGAKLLSTDEVKVTLIGATVTDSPAGTAELQLNYKSDGSITGQWNDRTISTSAFGTWKIDSDKFCYSVQFQLAREPDSSSARPFSRCPQFIFKVDEKYFFSESNSDRSAPAREAKISR